MIDILLKYIILWYEFLNDLDAKTDFEKTGKVEPFLSQVCSKNTLYLCGPQLCKLFSRKLDF